MEDKHTLRIYFGDEQANLYTIGYLSSDLFQLLTLCELLDHRQERDLEKYFFAKKRPAYLNRYSKIYRENISFGRITDVEKGSVELVLAEIGTTAAILIPFAVLGTQLLIERTRQRVTFNVSVDDPLIHQHLDAYRKHVFGTGDQGLETFLKYLSLKNYDIRSMTDRVYEISQVTEHVSNRMARTLRMN